MAKLIRNPQERVKIDAPAEDLVDLVKEAFSSESTIPFELVKTNEQDIPRRLPPDYGTEQSVSGYPLPLRQTPSLTSPESTPPPESTMDRLRTALSNPPQISDYHPSKLRRIGAAITGGLTGAAQGPEVGMKVASGILEQPYREQYQDWLTRSVALGDLAKLELEQEKAGYSGLSGLSSYLRTIMQPELEEQRQEGRLGLEGVRQIGRKEIEGIRDIRVEGQSRAAGERTKEQVKGAGERSEAQIKSREKIAREQIQSRENIARLNRELRQKLGLTKNQRISPQQQNYAISIAENEIAKIVSNPNELEALFRQTKDASGHVIYQLKSDAEITDPNWKRKRDTRKKEIDAIVNQMMKTSFNPVGESEEFEEDEDEYDIEEIQ